MPIDVNMPALSPTMEKGTLARWRVAPGDQVKTGDNIAEVETDKVTMEIQAPDSGFVSELLVAGGAEDIPVGVIAQLAEDPIGAPTGWWTRPSSRRRRTSPRPMSMLITGASAS